MVSTAEMTNLNTDIDIRVAPPTEYAFAGSSLLPEGTYQFYLRKWERGQSRDGQPDNRYLRLRELEVANGPHAGRRVFGLTIWTKVYDRRGKAASGLGDLIYGIDSTTTFQDMDDVTTILNQAQDTLTPIQIRVRWIAFDQDTYDEQDGRNMEKPDQKVLRAKLTVKGMKNFPQAPDGSYIPTFKLEDGRELEAQLEIAEITPSHLRKNI